MRKLAVAVARGAPGVGPDSGYELAVAKGLHDVVIGAGVEGSDLVVLARPRRQDEDRDARAPPPDLLE